MSNDTKIAETPTVVDPIVAPTQALTAPIPASEQVLTTADDEFIEFGDDSGIGQIAREDQQIARLAIAQGMSPQMKDGDAAYIDGLKLGHMFNTLSGVIYGKEPIEVVLVRRDPPRWVEFDEDRNIVDKDVSPDDKRTEWRTLDGKRTPPIATVFYDFLAVVVHTNDIVAISLAKSGVKAAKKLNGLIPEPVPVNTTKGRSMRVVPIYAKRYRVEPVLGPPVPQGGSYWIFKFEYAGLVTNRDLYNSVKGLSAAMASREMNFDRAQTANEAVGGEVIDGSTSAPSM